MIQDHPSGNEHSSIVRSNTLPSNAVRSNAGPSSMIAPPHPPPGSRSAGMASTRASAWLLALLLALVFSLAWTPEGSVAQAQLTDDATTSTRGTQFVKPEVEPPPPPKATPEPPPPPRQAAAVRKPAAEPARYPSVVFLVDTSDSMLNPVEGKKTRLDEAKAALIRVLEAMAPETQVQIWTFNTRLQPVLIRGVREGQFIAIGKGKSRQALVEQVGQFSTAGGTNLYQSVVKALAVFDARRDQQAYRSGERFPVLVVLSDGEDGGKTRDTLEHVQKAKQAHPLVTVTAIGFTIERGDHWFQVLCKIATNPEGCATAGEESQLQQMLDSFYRHPSRK